MDEDFKLSWQMNLPKSSRTTSHVNVELKTNVSEISYVSIFRVDVVNEHISLIYTEGSKKK
jgi:hypothetical protein